MSIYLAAKTPKIFRFSKNGAKKPPIFSIADFNHIQTFTSMKVNHSIKFRLNYFFRLFLVSVISFFYRLSRRMFFVLIQLRSFLFSSFSMCSVNFIYFTGTNSVSQTVPE